MPTRSLLRPCLREHAGTGLQDQLRRIRQGRWPSYKKELKDIVLDTPIGVPEAVRLRLRDHFTPSTLAQGDIGLGGASRRLAVPADRLQPRASVLGAFGLDEEALPSVQDLGRRLVQMDKDLPDGEEGFDDFDAFEAASDSESEAAER